MPNATEQKYWVYVRGRVEVSAKSEKEALELGEKLAKNIPNLEVRKIGAFEITK